MMMVTVASTLYLLLLYPVSALFTLPSPWGYRCVSARCVKEENTGIAGLVSLNQCKLTCGPYGVLWPQPITAILDTKVKHFLPRNVFYQPPICRPQVCQLLQQAFNIFRQNLERYHPDFSQGSSPWTDPWDSSSLSHRVEVKLVVKGNETYLTLGTDESYALQVLTSEGVTSVTITAETFFGARHGLETLLHLVEFHETRGTLMIVSAANVTDAPAFKYRGLLLDTSRNFFSVEAIERTLDVMAANKLNTFHWHITDSNTFPLYLDSLPNMAFYGAYSSRQIYHPKDVRWLVQYGRVRGIRVLPELVAPSHMGNGWQWGEKQGLGKLAVCVNKEPWTEYCPGPPCGQLNLANPNAYLVLANIYQELTQLFAPLDLFHYGGDKVNLQCWNTSKEMTSWMLENNFGLDTNAYLQQWSKFHEKARQLLTSANNNVEVPGILWTSNLMTNGGLDKYLNNQHYIVQIWTNNSDPLIGELLRKNYRIIFSNFDAWYLDCGVGAWTGEEGPNWCSPYKAWQTVYSNSPHNIAHNLLGSTYSHLILGGEACLWTEQTDEATLDAKFWPRGAALAERLWSNPTTTWKAAEFRFIHHRQRLIQRGVQADRLQPQWCHQNEGLCDQ